MDLFSERLSRLMKSRGVTQKALAEGIKTSERLIRYYVAGEKKPEYDNLRAMAIFLGTSMDYLGGISDDPLTSEERARRDNELAAGQD